jgi:hypothetical protein
LRDTVPCGISCGARYRAVRDTVQGAEALALVVDTLSSRRRLLQEPFAFSERIYATGPCATIAAERRTVSIVAALHGRIVAASHGRIVAVLHGRVVCSVIIYNTQLCNMHHAACNMQSPLETCEQPAHAARCSAACSNRCVRQERLRVRGDDGREGGGPLPHLCRDWAHLGHFCTGTWLTPAHICAGTGLTPATSAPGLG